MILVDVVAAPFCNSFKRCFSLTGDSGLAPIHSIKKLKSIFSEKANEQQQSHLQSHQPPSLPPPPSPRTRELKVGLAYVVNGEFKKNLWERSVTGG